MPGPKRANLSFGGMKGWRATRNQCPGRGEITRGHTSLRPGHRYDVAGRKEVDILRVSIRKIESRPVGRMAIAMADEHARRRAGASCVDSPIVHDACFQLPLVEQRWRYAKGGHTMRIGRAVVSAVLLYP